MLEGRSLVRTQFPGNSAPR